MCTGNDLRMDVFCVGQGNFIVLRINDVALIVDFGMGKKHYDLDSFYGFLVDSFGGVNGCGIVVTHRHGDHFDYGILKYICSNNIFKGTFAYSEYLEPCNTTKELLYQHNDSDLFNEITRKFAEKNVLIEAIIPESVWLNPIEKKHNTVIDHQHNTVVKISYRGRSILLPGDAGAALFAHCCNNFPNLCKYYSNWNGTVNGHTFNDFPSWVNNAAVLVLPHHGSWANGEQFWLEAFLKDSNVPNNPKLCIISSDPWYGHHLPRIDYMASMLNNDYINNISGYGVNPHWIACFTKDKRQRTETGNGVNEPLISEEEEDGNGQRQLYITRIESNGNSELVQQQVQNENVKIIGKCKNSNKCSRIEKRELNSVYDFITQLPVFLTSCAGSCCYTVVIRNNGDVQLFDVDGCMFQSPYR
jgi:beta-lactamase superfamily II metal-dependent hydrolase